MHSYSVGTRKAALCFSPLGLVSFSAGCLCLLQAGLDKGFAGGSHLLLLWESSRSVPSSALECGLLFAGSETGSTTSVVSYASLGPKSGIFGVDGGTL